MITLAMMTVLSIDSPATWQFAEPVRIEAGGEAIDVTTGHAAPYVYDFDDDGVRDLLVGEFGEHPYKGPVSIEGGGGHPWVQGRLRIYRNLGTDTEPRFKDFAYFKAGGEIAAVPITCCVSFVPQFVDYDNDGVDDVLSASYPGDMYVWKGNGDGTYAKAMHLEDEDGEPLVAWKSIPEKYREKAGKDRQNVHSTTAELHDLDGDGDLDLWIGSRLDGCFTIENIGTRAMPRWSTTTRPVKEESGKLVGGWDWGSNVHWHDWDRDGVPDILVGSEDGGVRWYRNVGEGDQPAFASPVVLVPDMTMDEMFAKLEEPVRSASRCKVHAVDWDGDGFTDLLVGDFGSKYHEIKILTPEEEARVEALDAEMAALNKRGIPLWNADSTLTEAQAKELEQIEAASEEIYEAMQELETHDQTSHGWVWLYRQVPAGKELTDAR